MTLLLISMLVLLGGATPGDAVRTEAPAYVAGCPARTPIGLSLVTTYASSDLHTRSRHRHGFRRVVADEIRPVTDGEACKRMMELLEARARSVGGTMSGSRPEFYEAGEHYYAVIPVEPSRCTPRPGHACIDTRWQTLIVFDRDYKLLAAIAI
jgi:hypothetical protein